MQINKTVIPKYLILIFFFIIIFIKDCLLFLVCLYFDELFEAKTEQNIFMPFVKRIKIRNGILAIDNIFERLVSSNLMIVGKHNCKIKTLDD